MITIDGNIMTVDEPDGSTWMIDIDADEINAIVVKAKKNGKFISYTSPGKYFIFEEGDAK